MHLNSAKKSALAIMSNTPDSDIHRESHMLTILSGRDSQKMIQINDINIKSKTKMN